MGMLRWMCGMTRWDRISNDNIRERERERERVGVAPIIEKMVETGLRLFEHMETVHVDFIIRRVY
jgi:hypothetical protein